MFHQRFAFTIEAVGVPRFGVYDFSVDIHGVIVLERRVASQHFVEQNSHSPPVHSFSVPLVEQDLGSDVLWSSANCVSPLSDYLSKTKVNHLQVAVCANHDVFWLQVSVDNVEALEVFENGHHLSSIKGSLLWVEVSHASVVREQISSLQQLSDKVDVLVILHESVVLHL